MNIFYIFLIFQNTIINLYINIFYKQKSLHQAITWYKDSLKSIIVLQTKN